MRQAGRSLPEYKAVRGEGTILDAIQDPDRATEITLQPVRRYGVDAAILFSDIVTPVWAVGFGIDITPGVGPTCEQPFASAADLTRLRPLDLDDDLWFQHRDRRQPGGASSTFRSSGSPAVRSRWPRTSIEGKPSRDYAKVKALMFGDPDLWHRLADRLADLAIATLTAPGRRTAPQRSSSSTRGPERCAPSTTESTCCLHSTQDHGGDGTISASPNPLRHQHRRAA